MCMKSVIFGIRIIAMAAIRKITFLHVHFMCLATYNAITALYENFKLCLNSFGPAIKKNVHSVNDLLVFKSTWCRI